MTTINQSTLDSGERPAALVTGGAIRLGKAIAEGLAQDGYDIALHYNSSDGAARETADRLRALGADCEIFACDFSDLAADFAGLIDRVRARFPRLNVLVNSASVYDQATLQDTDAALLDKQFAVNFRAPLLLMRAFAAAINGTDGSNANNIVNIIDNKIAFHQYQYAAYLLSKKALADLTRIAAAEFAPNIRVNGVAPGVVLPAGERTPEYIRWREQAIPVQRKGEASEIQQAVRSVLENGFITGQILFIDGGESLGDTGRNAASYPGD
ncbi:MAG: SDR family oxidoreductase [bacterium]|nr:SDR family oxidoreductase [bacterium]